MRKLFLLLLLPFLSFPLFAQTADLRGLKVVVSQLEGQTAVVGKQYAVLIAINKYQNWMALRNPVKDAKEIQEILSRRYYMSDFMELYDEEATKSGIIKLFKKLIDTTKPEDSVLIFYAGHGHLDTSSNTGFWIPVDGGTDVDEQANWLPNNQIRGFISSIKARHVALIADSCFSGDILNPSRGLAPTITNEYFKNAYERVSRQVLTSGASETVPDESQFSRQLKLALEGNNSPYLDPLMLYNQIRLGVTQTTPLFGDLKDSGHQEGSSFLLFLRNDAGTGPTPAPAVTVVPAPSVVTPTITVSRSYGSLSITTATAGTLYLDGKQMADLPEGAQAMLDSVEVGERSLEIRYADGQVEKQSATVDKGGATGVSFTYKKALPPAVVAASSAEMVSVTGGTFTMGSPSSEQGRNDNEVQHQVTVSSFHMGKFDVTQDLYQSVMGSNPSHFTGDGTRPVEQVSWYDAVAFCNKLSARDGLQTVYTINGTNVTANWSANGYRLPTEAEWEYAARGGQQGASAYHVYAGSDNLDQVAWYSGNSGNTTHPVGQKAPNALGLYDMSGNVLQWCWDWYAANAGSGQNPRGASSGAYRVLRSGSWFLDAQIARVAFRGFNTPAIRYHYLGFRLVRP